MRQKNISWIFLAIIGIMPVFAKDSEPKVLGTFGKWTAYQYMEAGQPVCYIAGEPEKSEGKYSQRGKVLALITHRPARKIFDEVNLIAGYPFPPKATVKVTIDEEEFTLFTKDDGAWAVDSETDTALVKAISAGNTMIVEGKSAKGTETTDRYSLKGFSKAYTMMTKACKQSKSVSKKGKPK